MKPKLILGNRRSGKTTRLLETVKWLKALIICPDQNFVRYIQTRIGNQKGYENVEIITCVNYIKALGKEYDIVCIEERRMYKNNDWYDLLYRSKIQPIITESLDNEHFDIEII